MRDIKHALLAATNSRSIVITLPSSLDKSFHVPDIIPAQRILGYYPQVKTLKLPLNLPLTLPFKPLGFQTRLIS